MIRPIILLIVVLVVSTVLPAEPRANAGQRDVLAFYYGWYGNPQVS